MQWNWEKKKLSRKFFSDTNELTVFDVQLGHRVGGPSVTQEHEEQQGEQGLGQVVALALHRLDHHFTGKVGTTAADGCMASRGQRRFDRCILLILSA